MHTRSSDPLVALWHDTTRALHWRSWCPLPSHEQAVMRLILCRELQELDHDPAWSKSPWAWRHTHWQLLELKACAGHSVWEGARGDEA